MGEPIYHERIGPNVASQLLQDDFIGGDNMSYYSVFELSGVTIIQHDEVTGEDHEVALENTNMRELPPVPRIESYSNDYDVKVSPFKIIQYAVMFVALVVVISLLTLYFSGNLF